MAKNRNDDDDSGALLAVAALGFGALALAALASNATEKRQAFARALNERTIPNGIEVVKVELTRHKQNKDWPVWIVTARFLGGQVGSVGFALRADQDPYEAATADDVSTRLFTWVSTAGANAS